MEYLERSIEPLLERGLRNAPVVIVTGARQTGKSTLVQRFAGAATRRYRTLDDFEDLELAEQEPGALLAGRKPLILDEVQRAPGVLRAIKREVDRNRRNGRFLLTGSANLLLMRRISETLAGRAQYLTLWPLSAAECAAQPGQLRLRALFSIERAEQVLDVFAEEDVPSLDHLDDLLLTGGYPPVVAAGSAEGRRLWFDGYVRTYLERDLQQLAQIEALVDFRRLMRIAALRIGKLVNQADLARDAGLKSATAHRYLNLLEVSYQILRLPAFAVNRTKRLIKAPRLFWTDTGLGAYLAGVDSDSISAQRGALLENFVLCQLLAWRETETPRPELTYWRTAAGEEVDFVIEWRGRLLPIEVKSRARPKRSDAAGLESFIREYDDQCPFGILAHTGSTCRLLSASVLAVPLSFLLAPDSRA